MLYKAADFETDAIFSDKSLFRLKCGFLQDLIRILARLRFIEAGKCHFDTALLSCSL